MRAILAILLMATLLAAPFALAESGRRADDTETSDDDRGRRHGGHGADDAEEDANGSRGRGRDAADAENATDARNDTERAARAAARAEVRAERAGAIAAMVERLHELRESWRENATALREACRAQELPENATKEERAERAHCIRDGYAEWRAERRAEMKELRLEMRELFASWRASRQA